jgi:hypothetical protein
VRIFRFPPLQSVPYSSSAGISIDMLPTAYSTPDGPENRFISLFCVFLASHRCAEGDLSVDSPRIPYSFSNFCANPKSSVCLSHAPSRRVKKTVDLWTLSRCSSRSRPQGRTFALRVNLTHLACPATQAALKRSLPPHLPSRWRIKVQIY